MTFEEKIRRLTLKAMFITDNILNRIVLKGGNALDIIYDITGRASLDLDFSISDDFGKDELPKIKSSIEKSLEKIFEPEGLKVFDFDIKERPKGLLPELENFWGGYKIEFKVTELTKFEVDKSNISKLRREAKNVTHHGKKFEIDISKHEYCDGKKQTEYDGYTIYVYTLEMIVFEKLRAICQQMDEYGPIVKTKQKKPRARDFFDIYKILSNSTQIDLSAKENLHLLVACFGKKKVPIEHLKLIGNYRIFHTEEYGVLASTVKASELKDFNFYFNYVLEVVDKLIKAL